jgi:hypothetical protein
MDEGSVRALAGRCGWLEVQHNPQSRVMVFMRGGMRVNVYYTTGARGQLASPVVAQNPDQGPSCVL